MDGFGNARNQIHLGGIYSISEWGGGRGMCNSGEILLGRGVIGEVDW